MGLGWIIAVLGLLSIFGYVTNIPQLYYAWEDLSTAMAFHTSILFALLGAGLIITAKKNEIVNVN